MRLQNWILVCYLLAFPVACWGALMAMQTFGNNLTGWPGNNTWVRRNLDQFQQEFETNDFVLISWPGCQLDDDRLTKIEIELSHEENSSMIESVWSGRSFYETLRSDLGLSHAAAVGRMRGSMLGSDGQQTCLVVNFTKSGSKDRGSVFQLLQDTLIKAKVDYGETRLAGPGLMMYQIDQESFWSPMRAIPWIVLFAFSLTWVFVRHFKLAIAILSTSVFMGLSSLAIVYASGTHLNLLVWTMPSLVLLLTTSATLHFLGYYRQALGSSKPIDDALRAAWRPIVFCSMTTAIGLFSLLLSDTAPVRDFGKFGGVSVLMSAFVVLVCFPCLLGVVGVSPEDLQSCSRSRSAWPILARMTCRYRVAIISIGMGLLGFFAFLLPRITTSVDISNFFPPDSKVMQDASWFAANVTPLSTIEMVVRFQDADSANDIDRMKFLQFLHREFNAHGSVQAVLSPATFSPRWPKTRRSASGIVAQNTVRKKVDSIKRQLNQSGMIHAPADRSSESWRMSIRVNDFQKIRPADLVRQLEAIVQEKFSEVQADRFSGESLELFSTGDAIILTFVESQVLRDLIVTYSTAFISISIVILLIVRSSVIAVLSTPPNLFPAVIVLGSMAAANVRLDVGSLITASVALGIAVDDTLHFVLWWRKKVISGMPSQDAILDALQHCGVAMVQTTMVCGLSIALYGLCGFLPTVRFGLLLSGMLFAALIGDLLLLPALLSTQLAERFVRQSSRI